MSDKIELRGIVTDALIGMISAVVEMSPPAGAPIPPFIQSAIDRAVERIASALAQQPAAAVPDGWKLVPVESSIAMEYAGCKAASRLMGFSEANRVYRAMLAAAPAAPVAQEPVAWQVRNGVVTHGFYRSEAEASEVAFDMQKAHNLGGSLAAFNVRPVYTAQTAADQPDTVAVPPELLAEAESIIESYAEALKASHAPGGDWEGEEAAQDGYEREAGVASKLRRLLAGGAE